MKRPGDVIGGVLTVLVSGALLLCFVADNAKFARGKQATQATVEAVNLGRRGSTDITVLLPAEFGGGSHVLTGLAYMPEVGSTIPVDVNLEADIPGPKVRLQGVGGIGGLVLGCGLFLAGGIFLVYVGFTREAPQR